MQRGIRLSGWKALAALGALVTIIAGIVIFALGVFVIVAPILLLASLAYYFLPRRNARSVRTDTPDSGTIINGEFRVVESKAVDGERRI